MSDKIYVDIPRMRGYIIVPSAASLIELGVPNLASAITREKITAWRSEEDGWAAHALEQTSEGVQLDYGELRSKRELLRSRIALHDAEIIDENQINQFNGSTGELVQRLRTVVARMDLEAATAEKPLSRWEKFRKNVFGIESGGWKILLLYIPEEKRNRVSFRPDPRELPYLFTEQRFTL